METYDFSSVGNCLLPFLAMSKWSNAKRATARLEARKIRCRARLARFKQVLRQAKTAAAVTHKKLKSQGFSSAFLLEQKNSLQSAKARLARLARGRKPLLDKFLKVPGEKKIIVPIFFVMLSMTTRKVEAVSNVGGDLLPGRHLAAAHRVQCIAKPRARKGRGATAPQDKTGMNEVFVLVSVWFSLFPFFFGG